MGPVNGLLSQFKSTKMDKSTTENKEPKKPVNQPDPAQAIKDARTEAANDIESDPDTYGQDSADDLDEGELARKDNSND